jgi:hypothetical protein
MSLTSIFSYNALESNLSHNIKWTLLSHVKYIVTSVGFESLWPSPLKDENFGDTTPTRLTNKPMFGVEFMGLQNIATGNKGIYIVSYRGPRRQITLKHEWAKMSESRRLCFLHDSILANLGELERKQSLDIYDFANKNNPPSKTGKIMNLEFIDSSFDVDDNTGERFDSCDWSFAIEERDTGL